jgi:putative transposase
MAPSSQLEGRIKTVTIRRKVDKWFVSFSCKVEPTPLAPCREALGIDVGVKHLVITSDGADPSPVFIVGII